jgi:putative ABC transport system permease protein
MKWFLAHLAIMNVLRQRLRAFLTIGGIALSTAIMVLLFGLGAGLQKMVTEQISRTDLQNVVTVSSKNMQSIKLDSEVISKIQSISGVTSLEQVANLSGQVTYHDIALVIPVYGVTSDYFKLSPIDKTAGETDGQMVGDAHNIILSEGALKAFGMSHNVVGKTISLNVTITKDNATKQAETTKQVAATDFVVRGIVDKGTTPIGYIPAEFLFKNGVNNASQLKVEVAYNDKIGAVRESIEQLGYTTTSVQVAIAQVNRIFGIIRRILVVFACITILVTVFGTVNTITIELVEATRQIGFLRVMGIRREDVGRLFMMQSIILSVSGVVVGVSAGLLFGLFTNGIIQALAGDSSASTQQGIYVYQIPILPIIIMLVLSIMLGWVIGLLPAKRAVRINPLAALKV